MGRILMIARLLGELLRPVEFEAVYGLANPRCVCHVSPGPCVTSDKGVAAQKKIWEDLVDTMARINPATVGAI